MDPKELSFLNFSNANEIENLYQRYINDPKSVDPTFVYFFQGMAFTGGASKGDSQHSKIERLRNAYRKFGHLEANLNPVALNQVEKVRHLDLSQLGFSEEDLEINYPTLGLLQEEAAPLSKIIQILRKTYCHTLGVECAIDSHPEIEEFIYQQIEQEFPKETSVEQKKELLKELLFAENFETFVQLRYPGQKRFSIEGGESFISLLHEIVKEAHLFECLEVVFGMAHRGRLNVLANILKKPYEEIFSEFEPKSKGFKEGLSGDVKYHKGHVHQEGNLRLTLCPNPSHLEAIDPVVLGRSRAKQLKIGELKKVLPVIIHGDAALSGQGIVYETMQMDGLDGFQNGGVLHIVINNQIGFTAKTEESRSTRYCTDIAKTFTCPVFHVNGEDPIMCVKVAKLAMQIRQKYGISVFIDYNCYRKYGHNETDEPKFTQPKLYEVIAAKETIATLYSNQLIQSGELTLEEKQVYHNSCKEILDQAKKNVETNWVKQEKILQNEPFPPAIVTAIPAENLIEIGNKLSTIPSDFTIHPKLKRMIQERAENLQKSITSPTIDFALCEQLAFATILMNQIPIRIVGEDSRRGTFSHRHAVLIDQSDEKIHFQLNHLQEKQAEITVYNSFLSEYAAMGYEYGFSVENPQSLVIWEAQFGDFANCSQVVIDQFLSSGYQKWTEESSLILFLPHGYEGMGPEHSSARIERFLQLAAQNNMEIIYPTIAAQMFHLLRHQALKKHKTPMIVFTPKALLRHKESFSKLQALTDGGFLDFVEEKTADCQKVDQLIFTIGKFVYEILSLQQKGELKNAAIIRIEKLYPINEKFLEEIVQKYPNINKIILAQEEPLNMGAASFLQEIFNRKFPTIRIRIIARKESASTAAGSAVLHQFEQELLLKALKEA